MNTVSESADGFDNALNESRSSEEDNLSIGDVHASAIRGLLDGRSSIDRWMVRASDWCSPILVKEMRQSLKGRQFQWTFVLLMFAIAGWTLYAILTSLPAIYFVPAGKYLLTGYIFLLIIPTCIVVPNAAYRSMFAELEQGTFDILTLAPLTSFQIVAGKLAVACVQGGIYFAALTPCFALTYLLRGVTWSSIGMTLFAIAIFSITEIAFGIMLGSLDRARRYSTLLSIAMIIISFGGSFTIFGSVVETVFELTSSTRDFSPVIISFFSSLLFLATYSVLFLLTASASIGLASENYSTTIRWWVLFQSMMFMGLVGLFFGYMMKELASSPGGFGTAMLNEMICMVFFIQAIHWSVTGIFFVSEQDFHTTRVRRRLPSQWWQRIFLSWTIPGSATGYIFVLLSFASVIITAIFMASPLLYYLSRAFPSNSFLIGDFSVIATLLWCWMALYLGLVRLCLIFFARKMPNRMVLGVAILLFFIFFGALSTLYISTWHSISSQPTYEWYSIFNIFWTLSNSKKLPVGSVELLCIVSGLVVFLNFISIPKAIARTQN